MRTNLILSFCLAFAASPLVAGCESSPTSADQQSTDEANGADEAALTEATLVGLDLVKEGAAEGVTILTSAAEFEEFFGAAPTAAIDFSSQWLIHYSLGERPTAGYEAAITGVKVSGPRWRRTVVVSTLETTPGPECFTAQVVTTPQAAVLIPRQRNVAAAWHEPETEVGACEAEPNGSFCAVVLCQAGTVCNEAARACEPIEPTDPVEPAACVVTGCSGQLCADAPVVSTCEWRPEYACFSQFSVCERDASGACGWRASAELDTCIGAAKGE